MNDFVDPVLPGQEEEIPASQPENLTAEKITSMIEEAVSRAVAEERKAWQEALRTETEKAENALLGREEAVKARENTLHEREMLAFAREKLLERALPDALLGALCCRDEQACLESLDQVEKAFRTAVQQGVMERMRGEEPLRADPMPLDTMDDNAYYHATYVK